MSLALSRVISRVFAFAALAFAAGVPAIPAAQNPPLPGEATFLVGDWKGESTCLDKQSACQDEKVVYHFSIGEKAGWYRVSADKIVSGAAVNMGTLEFRYDAERHTLVCETPRGDMWELKVQGDKMEGTLTRANKTLFRRVSLTKEGKGKG